MTQAVSVSPLNPSGAPEVGADRALVASDGARAGLHPSGFDHGEAEAVAEAIYETRPDMWQGNIILLWAQLPTQRQDVSRKLARAAISALDKARGEA